MWQSNAQKTFTPSTSLHQHAPIHLVAIHSHFYPEICVNKSFLFASLSLTLLSAHCLSAAEERVATCLSFLCLQKGEEIDLIQLQEGLTVLLFFYLLGKFESFEVN